MLAAPRNADFPRDSEFLSVLTAPTSHALVIAEGLIRGGRGCTRQLTHKSLCELKMMHYVRERA
jgi:hypothetical protein